MTSPRLGLLDYLMLYAPDVERATAFYRDVLDGGVIEEAYPHWARVRVANIDIGLHAGEAAGMGGEPAFRVHDIAAFRAHLEAAGVALDEYHQIPGGVKMAFADPSGNRLQAVQYGTSLDALHASG
jgi:catechol 2,3-dioxygenase-like lactoylglutathione lyase family enzyme